MQSIIRSNEINNHESVKEFFYYLDKLAKDREGYLYYKYPMSATDYEHMKNLKHMKSIIFGHMRMYNIVFRCRTIL